MKRSFSKSELAIAILIPLAVGTLSSLLSGNMTLYRSVNKPSFSPPGTLFPIVWAILYILMGISSYLIYQSDHPLRNKALKTYAIQLLFNFGWSLLFFRFQLFFPAFLWLLIMIFFIVKMIVLFYQIKPIAAYLQIPYLLWCLFAAYLNFTIYQLN